MKINKIPELTRISSKGQLVIPKDIREELHIKEGEVFATKSAKEDMIVLKRIKNKIVQEDLMLIKEVEKAWKEIESGRFRRMDKEDFLKEIKKW